MCAAKRVRSPRSLANTGTAMIPGYIAAPAAAPRYSIRIPSSIPAQAGLLFGNLSIPPTSPQRKIAVFSCGEPKLCALDAVRILGMCLKTALLPPVCAIASIRPHSSSIANQIRHKQWQTPRRGCWSHTPALAVQASTGSHTRFFFGIYAFYCASVRSRTRNSIAFSMGNRHNCCTDSRLELFFIYEVFL